MASTWPPCCFFDTHRSQNRMSKANQPTGVVGATYSWAATSFVSSKHLDCLHLHACATEIHVILRLRPVRSFQTQIQDGWPLLNSISKLQFPADSAWIHLHAATENASQGLILLPVELKFLQFHRWNCCLIRRCWVPNFSAQRIANHVKVY